MKRQSSIYDESQGNKLRTYNLYKGEFEYEAYLSVIKNRDKRILTTKLRIGICPLRVETGRYENIGARKRIEPRERVCLVCGSGEIEDEFHFMMKCSVYNDEREGLEGYK